MYDASKQSAEVKLQKLYDMATLVPAIVLLVMFLLLTFGYATSLKENWLMSTRKQNLQSAESRKNYQI